MDFAKLERRWILGLAESQTVSGFVHRHGARLGARRFVAGETLDEALAIVRRLNQDKIAVTLDHLGESVTDAREAVAQAEVYQELVRAIASHRLDAGASLKLTQMGLDIDRDLCLQNVSAIVERAAQDDIFVRIDMEDSQHTDLTLQLVGALRHRFQNVGTVLQAYLYRTADDLAALHGDNVRIVKGAYNEPARIAFAAKSDVDQNYLKLVDRCLRDGQYVAVATHDEAIIGQVERWVKEREIPRDRFEFQMLYGLRMRRQRELAAQGYRVRCYVPYGADWYAYFMRRLAERPANLLFFLRGLVQG